MPSVTFVGISGHVAGILPVTFTGTSVTIPESPVTLVRNTHFEEAGLQVELIGFLCDSVRSTSVTRYYLARRLGGNPAGMCWESQAVHLVPAAQLAALVSHPNDRAIVVALQNATP